MVKWKKTKNWSEWKCQLNNDVFLLVEEVSFSNSRYRVSVDIRGARCHQSYPYKTLKEAKAGAVENFLILRTCLNEAAIESGIIHNGRN